MPTTASPPILIYQPGGGVPVGPISNPPVYSQSGITQLIQGQAYINVVFGSIQTMEDWVLVACDVEKTTDFEPLNIWPGIITDRTTAGFRLQLNGMPDSGNYYLHWAVSGVNIVPSAASTYYLTGPSTGGVGAPVMFTVRLPPSTTVPGAITIMPSDGGAGGSFNVSSVVLSTTNASATFSYTPIAVGTVTISTTNSSSVLSDPAGIVLTVTPPAATTYTLTGPSTGTSGVASTNFTVALPGGTAVTGTVTITPSSGGGGGSFTPATVGLTTAAPSATFTYTPSSVGAKTISVTNNGGLTDPGNLTYTATAPPLVDGDPVSSWPDSSGNGHTATQTGSSRPIYKTGIIGGKPVVRFTTAGTSGLNLVTPISGAGAFTTIVVSKLAAPGGTLFSLASLTGNFPLGIGPAGGNTYVADRTGYIYVPSTDFSGAFHVLTGMINGSGSGSVYADGTSQGINVGAASATGNLDSLGYRSFTPTYSDGDIAEILQFNVQLSSTDRANVEKYLGTKYGITVAGGSAVDPSTVSSLVGWWKADAL